MPGPSNIRKAPTKIPRDYVLRTMRRLLPSAELIKTLDKDKLIALSLEKRRLEQLITQDPARFFHPNNGGQKAFLTWWDIEQTKRVLLFLAGNKAGKTTAGSLLMGERLLGKPLWNREERAGAIFRPVPAVGICFTEDFESHRDTILPTILSWWPKADIKRIYYNNSNCPSEMELTNGSVCKFKTYAQGAETAEGKDWDIVWNDEPPPHSVYTAQFRGIVSHDGQILITATLLKEAWIYDEIDQAYAQGFTAEIHDNQWISREAKEAFLESLSPEEREVRESGKPFNLTGVIYRHFKDDAPYVIDPIEPGENWPIFLGVDPHERKPVHIGIFTLTPQNEPIMLDYALPRGNITEIFQQLDAKLARMNLPQLPRLVIMDPNRGRAKQLNNISWEQVFTEQGYDVVLGQDDVNIGHTKMFEYLRIHPDTQRPRLMFTTNCRGRGGPIWQFQRYAWDEWVNARTRGEKDVKEKPKQFNKDFPDICRYVAMEDLDFSILTRGPQIIRTIKTGYRPYGRVL